MTVDPIIDMDGGYGQFVSVPVDRLYALPDSIPMTHAPMVGIWFGTHILQRGQVHVRGVGGDSGCRVIKEAQIIASRVTCGEFPRAIQMMSRGLLHPDLLITSVQPPGDITRAFEQVDRKNPNTIKVV